MLAKLVQRLAQPCNSLLARNVPFRPALHGTDNGRSAEFPRQINDLADEFPCLLSDLCAGMGKMPLVNDPGCPCSKRRHFQSVLVEKMMQVLPVNRICRWRKDFHGVKTQGGRLCAARRQIVPENERPVFRLGNQGNGDGRFHNCIALILLLATQYACPGGPPAPHGEAPGYCEAFPGCRL